MENGILAFPHNSSEDRTMRIEKSLRNDRIVSREDMDARVTASFDNIKIEFDEHSKRPYIMFRDGEVKSVSGDFPFDIQNIRFGQGKRPPVEIRWELSNEELIELVGNGLYGYGPNRPKMKEQLHIPDIFMETDFKNIPVKVDVFATEYVDEDEKRIPVISCSIINPYGCVTNSEETDYGNIASFFEKAKQEFAPNNDRQFKKNMPTNELWGYVPELEDELIVRPERTLSKEEEAERQLCAILAAEIAARRDEHITSADIDRIVEDTGVAVENLFDEHNEAFIDADEAMTDAELAMLHLTAGDDDHKKARSKLTENAVSKAAGIQSMNEQQELYAYEKDSVMNSDDYIPSL